jgi:outer membrane protein OmpA-like peptidoglycan-associated protein
MQLRTRYPHLLVTLLTLGVASPANAASDQPQEPAAEPAGTASAGGSISLGGSEASAQAEAPQAAAAEPQAGGEASSSPVAGADEEGWFKRLKPQAGMLEFGVYGGALWLNSKHQLFGGAEKNELNRWRKYPGIIPEVGLRLGYYPASFLGIEAEGSILPTKAKAQAGLESANALIWSGRGHLVLQAPIGAITPFILGGVGALGISSPDASGVDADLAAHFGGGVKIYLSRYVGLRLDARDVFAPRRGTGAKLKNHNFEALLGLSFTFGRKEKEVVAAPVEEPPADSDGDGIVDSSDACPNAAETVNSIDDLDGCPETDRDGDGFWDFPNQDACPDEAGVAPDGCPIRDTDNDGILDPDDKCPSEPEVRNGFEDSDGCPDEVPKEEVAQFSGSIDGIVFDSGKATIAPSSYPTLDRAAELLTKYPTLKLEISGHTDSVGNDAKNQKLSEDRANAVRDYIVGKGIDAARLSTRGAGETEPVADNKKKEGRAKNRRIEFKIAQ